MAEAGRAQNFPDPGCSHVTWNVCFKLRGGCARPTSKAPVWFPVFLRLGVFVAGVGVAIPCRHLLLWLRLRLTDFPSTLENSITTSLLSHLPFVLYTWSIHIQHNTTTLGNNTTVHRRTW